jgi:hypothetical protein
MRSDALISSAETDGVGLRLCIKTPIDMQRFVVPFLTPEQAEARAVSCKAKAKVRSTRGTGADAASSCSGEPVFGGVDTGRAKLFMAAVSKSATKKPQSVGFTRA